MLCDRKTMTPTDQVGNMRSGRRNLVLKVLIQAVVLLPVLSALLFIPAGHLDWIMGWVSVGVYLASLLISSLLLIMRDPSLAGERREVPESAEAWDKRLINLYNVLIYLVMLPLAGLDERFKWSPRVDLSVQLLGLAIVVAGCGLFVWAMMSNRFFSAVVRIQEERGHTVVSDGPYRYVRHPGYVGMMSMFLGAPLMLGSLWAGIPAVCAAAVVLVRTVLEDRALMERLEGYQDYARQVRYRLLPRIW
jgi:protein-S-isoprenylcysteine O-methyltransferase Ste14